MMTMTTTTTRKMDLSGRKGKMLENTKKKM